MKKLVKWSENRRKVRVICDIKRWIKRKARKIPGPNGLGEKGLTLLTAYVTAGYGYFLFGLSPNKTGLEQVYILPVVGTDVAELEGS